MGDLEAFDVSGDNKANHATLLRAMPEDLTTCHIDFYMVEINIK